MSSNEDIAWDFLFGLVVLFVWWNVHPESLTAIVQWVAAQVGLHP